MVAVVIIYAGNILIGKAINDLPPFTIAMIRFMIAFAILFPIGFHAAWKNRATFLEHKVPFLIMTLSGVAFFNMFIYGALQYTSASNVAVLETVIPVTTILLSAFFLKERLIRIQWIGILLSFIGAIWVVLDGQFFQLTSMAWNIGDVIMIGAIISWAVYSIYVKQYMHLFPPYAAIFLMTGISMIVLFPFVVVEWVVMGIPTFDVSNHLPGLLYFGIFPSLVALVFYNRAVDLLGPSQASIFLNFLPVFTMIGAYLWLNETVTVVQVVGAFVVMGGVLLTTQVKKKEEKVDIPVVKEHA
ncbi:DMT family transporter [Bacillus sp. FJAT-45350]|uniref:DMT family transporter n=1 Tax=Bacillus sp. FJAT-45350 TaxID=2011014 RepID=UPI000BB97419|nr:DMT family transporter [Bacillus sp. FJAT-45350]